MTTSLAPSINAELQQRFLEIRNTSLRIAGPLSAEDQMLQSMPDASPTKWHLAHTTWFFETFILQPLMRDYQPFDSRYKILFNSYYKQLGSHPYRGSRGLMSRPNLKEVYEYRAHVDDAMKSIFEHAPFDILSLVELGLNHEQQHQELIITDIKHALWSSPLPPGRLSDMRLQGAPASPRWIEIQGGVHSTGFDGTGFSFDNESPRHEVLLQDFSIASRSVTNGEYLRFIDDSGYKRPELWLSDGWDAVCSQGWTAPLYWRHEEDGSWWSFVLDGTGKSGMRPVNSAEPVCHISYYEADAFARWAGARLPNEAEWEVAASQASANGSFLDDQIFHPQSVEATDRLQMFGNVWEWTASPYTPYPGFRPAGGLIGEYNGKFMCNQLVLRGGSCATPASHIRASYRNFFPPHARWQFSGLRLAK